jgi:hypothetical protein
METAATVAELLRDSAVAVLRDAAFVFAEEAEAPTPLRGEVVEASIGFWNPEPGHLAIRCSAELCVLCAANLLGQDPEEVEASRDGSAALGELVNMLGGQLLEKRCMDRSRCRLGLPVVRRYPSSSALPAGPGDVTVALSTDEGERVDVLFGPGGCE